MSRRPGKRTPAMLACPERTVLALARRPARSFHHHLIPRRPRRPRRPLVGGMYAVCGATSRRDTAPSCKHPRRADRDSTRSSLSLPGPAATRTRLLARQLVDQSKASELPWTRPPRAQCRSSVGSAGRASAHSTVWLLLGCFPGAPHTYLPTYYLPTYSANAHF